MTQALTGLKLNKTAGVAQSVEQLIRNQQVKGSSPLAGSIEKSKVCSVFQSVINLSPRPAEFLIFASFIKFSQVLKGGVSKMISNFFRKIAYN